MFTYLAAAGGPYGSEPVVGAPPIAFSPHLHTLITPQALEALYWPY